MFVTGRIDNAALKNCTLIEVTNLNTTGMR
jgi:hypothetical protein